MDLNILILICKATRRYNKIKIKETRKWIIFLTTVYFILFYAYYFIKMLETRSQTLSGGS